MTRAAALLAPALALAVAACGPPPPPPYADVTFYWRFQDLDGNVYGDWTAYDPGCGIANVDHVRVSYTGPGVVDSFTATCTVGGEPGAMPPTSLPAGSYTWTVEGLRQGLVVFSANGAGEFVNLAYFDVTLLAVYPNMDLWYQLPLGQTCAGVAEIAFELDNLDGGVVEYGSNNVMVACRAPPNNGFTMPSIPVGNYGYRFVSAINAPWPNGAALYQVCGLGYPPQAPLVQTLPNGNAYTAPLDYAIGTCP